VIDIHLKGHAALSRAAAVYWRAESKKVDGPVFARVVNTASEAFLLGGAGQANYAAAKAGIVALTLSTARGLSRYGVTANAICPRGRTEMTEAVFKQTAAADGMDLMAPERVATLVSFLASPAAADVTGQVFIVYGDMVALMAAPVVAEKFVADSGTFSVDELAAKVVPYVQGLDGANYVASSINALDTTGAV